MKSKAWYVTMQQKEIESFDNPFERLVYEAIKSFCGNGKTESGISNSEIAKRGNVSKMTVGRYIPVLIKKSFVRIVGSTTRVGGTVKIYRVCPEVIEGVTTSNALSEKSVTQRYESVTPSGESVTDVGIKPSNIKRKEITHFSYKKENNSKKVGFSTEFKDDLFRIAEAISVGGTIK